MGAAGSAARGLLGDVGTGATPLPGATGLARSCVLGRPHASLATLLLLESLGLIPQKALPGPNTERGLKGLGGAPLGTQAALPGASPILHPQLPHRARLVAERNRGRRHAVGHLLLPEPRPAPVRALHSPGAIPHPILVLLHGAELIARQGLLAPVATSHPTLGATHAAATPGKGICGRR